MKIGVQKAARMKKVKLSILYTPPLQNHYFGVPMKAKMEPQWRLETVCMAIENDDGTEILFKELLETFLHLKPLAVERRVPAWDLEMAPRLDIDISVGVALMILVSMHILILKCFDAGSMTF